MVSFMTLTAVSASAYDFEANGIYYNINIQDRTASVTNGDNKYEGDIVIPSSVTYANQEIPVTEIGENAFRNCSSLTSIEIPNSVTEVGRYAFWESI